MKTSYQYKLYGAIWGDLVGRPYEFPKVKKEITNVDVYPTNSAITDDSLMTLATAYSILEGVNISEAYKFWGRKYDGDYYGPGFKKWIHEEDGFRFDSWGNGCLMRISPYMYIKDSLPALIKSIQCSHNHEQSFEACMKLWNAYKYDDQGNDYDKPWPFEKFKVDSKSTIEFCLNVFNYMRTHNNKLFTTKDCIIKAVECGGDTDTNASIIAELTNFHLQDLTKIDAEFIESKLDSFQLETLLKFNKLIN